MSVKPSLQLKLGQQLTMTPQLQQAIRLLQLSSLDLQAEIQTIIENNPLIECPEESKEVSLEALKQKEQSNKEPNEMPPQSPWEDRIPYPTKGQASEDFEPQRAQESTLTDHLIWQMQLTPFTETDQQIATAIIDGINEDGLLETDLNDIKDLIVSDEPVEDDEILTVLHRIQQFDPIGVGARDLKECLLIQLNHFPADTPWLSQAKTCISKHIDLLAKKDYATLRRKLKVQEDELREIIRFIQALNPRPGSEIGTQKTDYVIPDAYVFKHDGKWIVELNPDNRPNLRINNHYAQLIKKADTSADNQYIKDQLQEARWFLKSLENRNETLLKVVESILDHQLDFFEHGEEHMKPMILHDVASKINMHESTVSRVTTKKYIHTPRGTYELKYFFSSHVQTQDGEDCSSTRIRALIKKYIAEEEKQKPLSDSKISILLKEAGINVARRTVAKYREAMKIPPSNERKRLV